MLKGQTQVPRRSRGRLKKIASLILSFNAHSMSSKITKVRLNLALTERFPHRRGLLRPGMIDTTARTTTSAQESSRDPNNSIDHVAGFESGGEGYPSTSHAAGHEPEALGDDPGFPDTLEPSDQ